MRLLGLALLLLAGCDDSPRTQEPVAVVANSGREAAAPPIEIPALSGRVVDEADLLTPVDEAALTETSADLERRTSDQLVVVTLPSLQGATIEAMGLTLGSRWGIGQADKDNGVLVLVAPNERMVRIEVGYGLEPILTDARAQAIIDNDMVPLFREGRLALGIAAGTRAIARLLIDQADRPRVGLS
jgi:uncharacterized protein